MTVPEVSLIIPAYNEEALLPATLASIHEAVRTTGIEAEIIVVDNASRDRTAEVATTHGARVVHEPHRQIARARNAGAKAARGAFFAFVDADTEIQPGLLRDAVRALRENRLCGGGAPIGFSGEPSPSALRMAGFWNRLAAFSRLAAGSFLFCRRDAFEAVGGFEVKVYAGEEIFLSRELQRWGRRHQLPFGFLRDSPPVRTSPRKLDWHKPLKIWWIHLSLALCPWLVRNRRFCRFWYERPEIPR